jgi:hypothetical protein
MKNSSFKNNWEEKKEKVLTSFYSSLISDEGKIDVYSYMRCYSYINGLPELDKNVHSKALLSARENFENKNVKVKVKKKK